MILVRRSAQILLLTFCASGLSQTASVVQDVAPFDRHTLEDLLHEAEKLKQKADKSDTGSASAVLEKYPGRFTMLGFRERNGNAELHKNYADVDFILDGSATLITGGTIVDPKTTNPGEVIGSSIRGGQNAIIHKGDILNIPANTPHQMLIPSGGSLTYFVIKVLEQNQ